MVSTPASKRAAVGRAAARAVEALEGRVFMHAGPHLTPSAVGPYNGQQQVAGGANVTVTFATGLNAATLTTNTFELRDENNVVVPAAVSYNAATRTATLDPVTALPVTNGYFTARVKGGSAGVLDAAGLTLEGDYTFSFTTGAAQFTQRQILGGLAKPTAMKFAPDGRVFVAEKSGLIKVFDNVDDTTPTVFADLRTQVHNFWDRGLLGLALHPNFPQAPYVYALYSYDGDIGGPAPKYGSPNTDSDPGPDATGAGARISARLTRLTASGNAMVPGSETVLINDWAQQFPSHSIGTLAFGPDGALYASAGDGASFSYADYGQTGNPFNDPVNEGGAVRSQDLRTPNDPTTLDGSIIRIDPDTGAALPDNPLFNTPGADANAKRIVAYGFRNPMRFTFRPGTAEIWSGDVGWSTWEEINRIPVSATAVANYGWPAYEGAPRQPGYDGLNLPVLENLYAAGPSAVVTPYFAYRHTDKVVPGSAEPTGGSSVSGVAFYNGGSYPAAYQDALFFSDYSRQAVYVMHRGVDGLPDPASRQLFKLGVGTVDLVAGPGGDLFLVDHSGKVFRYTYNSANRPPDAVLTADRTSGPAPLQVQFSAANSTDPDAVDTLSYAWDLDGDGAFDDSTAVNPTYAYTEAGTYVVRLRVTDPKGASDVAQVSVTAGNTAPVPTITSPSVSLRWKVGDVVSFGGGATDQQDGALAASNLRWQLILRHENATAPGTYHEHVVQEFAGVAGGTFVAPDHEYPSSLELRLTATDSGGLVSSTAVVLQPLTSTVTFASNVVGARISFNGESVAAPFSRTVIVGSASSIVATTPQAVNGVIYNFVSWSDNGAATHNIVATAADATYTATFAAAATVPVPWQARDVGAVGLAGTSAYDAATGTFTVAGAGADIWGTEDSFHYLHQQVTGDVQIVARVKSTERTHGSSKAGLQIRQSLAADAANVQIDAEGAGDWGEFHVRATTGGETATRPFTMNTPHWLRLTRVGDVFTAARSFDGQTWEQIAQETVVMTGPVLIGLAVCSHDVTLLNTALFDNVSVTAATAPNAKPTITVPAAAAVAADARSAAVSVTATDDGGAATLRYTWTQASGPATAEFSASNGTNAARALTATFAKAGSYVLRVTVADGLGATSTSDVTVNVQQVLTDVVVTPIGVSVPAGGTWQFAAVARDQFLAALATQPTFAWTVDAGGVGTVSAAGLYTAPATGSGSATVRATAGGRGGTAAVAVTAAPSGDVTSGLVNRWRFDENAGTLADDAVGPNNGTLTNGATWAAGKAGSALALDGTDDYVATASNLANTLGGSATLTAWIKTTQVGTDTFWTAPGIAGAEKYWGNEDVFWGFLDAQGRIAVQAGDDPAAVSTSAVNDGLWHHVAFTRDAATGQLRVYVDGALQATAAGGVGVKTTPFNSIGRIENTNGPANHLRGGLDDVRVYDRILSAAEVVAVRDNVATGGPVSPPPTPPPPPVNAAPTVATAAKVAPTAPVVGVPAALSVAGADDGGEAKLTYTWSVVTAPAGAVAPTFSANGTNAAKAATVRFNTAGAYTLRCTISDGAKSVTSTVSATAAAFTSAKVNFQPAAAAAVGGYTVDSGNTFAVRTSALSFGWNNSHTTTVYDRAKNNNQLLDTVVLMNAGARWELAVPSGTYSVKVSVGDPSAAKTNTLRVEGTAAFTNAATAANAFQTKTVSVVVTDGRLTIDNGSAAGLATALNYVEVTRTGNAP